MDELQPPDSHYLSAALGWLELGNLDEARLEWQQISEGSREFPEVMEVAWQIHAMAREWDHALGVARRLREVLPDNPAGWICQSYSLHELKLTQEAWDELRSVADRFDEEATIPYNLACYACQLGQLEEARSWLKRAIKIKPRFRGMAKQDPDLEPIRDQVSRL